VDEVPEDPEGRPSGVRRGTDDRDAPRRPEELAGRIAVEDRYRAATLLEIEVGDRSRPLRLAPADSVRCRVRSGISIVAQVADSRSYGRPSAAGGTLRPTIPARMMIVTRYGSAP
jgi:hypothetical protein